VGLVIFVTVSLEEPVFTDCHLHGVWWQTWYVCCALWLWAKNYVRIISDDYLVHRQWRLVTRAALIGSAAARLNLVSRAFTPALDLTWKHICQRRSTLQQTVDASVRPSAPPLTACRLVPTQTSYRIKCRCCSA